MRYYLRKALGLIITVVLVSLITFSVFQILPGNPAKIILGVDADPLQIEALSKSMGLDRPVPERYLAWVRALFSGDLGISYRYQQPVSTLIADALQVTGSLCIVTLILTALIGIPAGVWLSFHGGKKYAVPLSMLSQISISIPTFCMGIFLTHLLSVRLKLLPSIGYTSWKEGLWPWLRSLLLPAFAQSLGSASILIRYVRVSVANQQKRDYVRTAYSKGLRSRAVMYRHVLRNSLIPVITILGIMTADVLGGSIIIENVFSMPGIGRLISISITSRDFPLLQGLTLYLALIVVICNFAVDIIYSIVDPRIRLGEEGKA